MRLLIVILIVLFVALQYRLWIGEGSFAEVKTLRRQIAEQKAELHKMQQDNIALRAEVEDLKQGLDVIEERARSELGMIRNGEVYFQIVEPETGDASD